MQFINRKLFFTLILAITFVGCKKIKDVVSDPALSQNLADALSSDPTLSKFSDYIKRTGVDSLLRSSKTFTVWAPNDNALQSLDPSIVADAAKLKAFVLNHIAFQTFFTRDVQTSIRVQMISGKYNNFFGNKIEDATVLTADKYVSNGVFHIIDKPLLVLPNLWDYINNTSSVYAQNAFIAGLNFSSFDPSIATVDSISKLTGFPVYHPGTGIVIKNTFNERTFDTKREDKQYTYFIIANANFTLKADELKPYFKTSNNAVTDSLDKWNIVKDLIVDTLYPTIASLPTTIVSKFGVALPVNPALIIDSKKVSNGMVYVLSSSTTTLALKFPPIKIEGENPTGFSRTDKTGNINLYRIRKDPVTGFNYADIYITATNVTGTGVIGFYSYYRLSEMPSMKYNVYARAVNDFQTAAVVQNISVNYVVSETPPVYTALSTFLYNVPLSTAAGAYNEVLLGQFTSTLYGTLEFRLIQSGTGAVATNTPSVLDYIRLVPVP